MNREQFFGYVSRSDSAGFSYQRRYFERLWVWFVLPIAKWELRLNTLPGSLLPDRSRNASVLLLRLAVTTAAGIPLQILARFLGILRTLGMSLDWFLEGFLCDLLQLHRNSAMYFRRN
jgi:hypothetical protein